jgi:ABC-2 type transport system permease protein
MRLLAKLTLVEMKLFIREPISLVFTFAFPLVVLVVLFGVFGDQPDYAFNYARPNDYYLASYVSVVIAAVSLVALPVHVATYRERGVIRRLRASSVPGAAVLTAQVLVALALVTAGTIVLVVAGVVGYDANPPDQTGATLVGFGLSALAFLALGFLLGNVARTARAAQAIGMLVFLPMWLLSGAGPPREVLSDGLAVVADLLPLTYAVRAVQDPWLGLGPNTTALAVMGAMLVGAAAAAVRAVRQV